MRLAILGDTHYTNAAYHVEALAGRSRSPTARADVARHVWTTEHVLPRVLEQVRAARPDVVVLLGDVNQGHCDDDAGDVAELAEALALFRRVERSLLFARGTHEGRPGSAADAAYRVTFLPEIARTMAAFGTAWPESDRDTSYLVDLGPLRLIVLDYTTFAPDGPADALLQRGLAEAAARGQRAIVCGHPPLIPIARPFFSRIEYATTVLSRISEATAPLDGYFCGHTHNQVATLHRLASGAWLPQLQGAPVGYPDQTAVPLADVRPLLPTRESVKWGWGFLEDSHPGFFLVDVTAESVVARWQLVSDPGRDRGIVRWTAAGEPQVAGGPPEPPPASLPALPLAPGTVRGVRLRAAGVGSRAPHRISLNGVDAGTLPALEYFDARQGVDLPERLWAAVGRENELRVEPAGPEDRCLGGFVLEVTVADGSVVRTASEPALYATSDKWESWRWCTPGLVRVEPLEPLVFHLDFG